MNPTGHRTSQRGVSLVEAIVAMAVMAFGMLGMVGLQATLRSNADLGRQRAEAVRIAQTTLESRRAYSVISSTPGRWAFDDIVDQPESTVPAIAGDNTTYKLTEAVTELSNPTRKFLVAEVRWLDRNNAEQSVRMATVLTAVSPALEGALSMPYEGSPAQFKYGRSRQIPSVAVDLGNGTSGFMPPQPTGGNVAMVFNNATGVVVLCATTAASTSLLNIGNISNCGAPLSFLSGNVRFAYSTVPTAAVAENPTDSALNLDLSLVAPPVTPEVAYCFDDSPATAGAAALQTGVSYYCAVSRNNNQRWSGTLTVEPAGLDGGPAWTIAASGSGAMKVCRYTPTASDTAPNPDHPRTYLDVAEVEVMTNQNFLVISAADSCPVDTAADPGTGNFVNSNTRQHQPSP